MWRRQWREYARSRTFAAGEYARQWGASRMWFRLTGRFRHFSGRGARFLAWVNKWVQRWNLRRYDGKGRQASPEVFGGRPARFLAWANERVQRWTRWRE
jgi:hypothetical protein